MFKYVIIGLIVVYSIYVIIKKIKDIKKGKFCAGCCNENCINCKKQKKAP